jgi:Insertion element 4 transposase N-terminal
MGVLTRAFPSDVVDEVVGATWTREQRRRLLPAPLMVYSVLALWLFWGRSSGYGQVMAKLADGLYHQRRGADLLVGQLDPDGWVNAGEGRRWKQPNISSLSRGRG